MAVADIHLLEVVQVNIQQSEDSDRVARRKDRILKKALETEAVLNAGEV